MLIRQVTINEINAWLSLAHESDDIVTELIPDISVFYEGFDDYMHDKISQNEAFMAEDRISGKCLGITAFSKKNNRISYLGVSQDADFQIVANKLIDVALNQLDSAREISVNVLKSNSEIITRERDLYRSYGFVECDDSVLEVGIPACLMKNAPSGTKKGYSFHYDYPGYIEWTDKQNCPICNNEQIMSEYVLIKELGYSLIKASIRAQGCLWGNCVVLSKKHYSEFNDIPLNDLTNFMSDVQKTGKALKDISKAVKINYELHGNTVPHLHIHLFPRYIDDLFPSGPIDFTITEPSPYESKAEFDYYIEQMRTKLGL